ncbi:MAG: septum formation initiator family protein [Gammaproteobacteria bacterium]|nr:septum formation initiator family protein [Gammaproteobacteria bacterium]MDH4252926.1 septum formation initiator family protein [Gammaproteobacteria bacterium]MDH5308388.1 septum formation initiator family protein [Gammaproteobacteria bacterium]
MGSSRWISLALAIVGIALQGELWLADDGFRKTRELRRAVDEQQLQNEELRARNSALDAEVLNLKHGREAAEERARTDLGMIGADETFYQVVPPERPVGD